MTLREKQSRFVYLLPLLIQYVYMCEYEITFSFHHKRLAIDLNLFYDGVYLKDTVDYTLFGKFWESLDSECYWGGHKNDRSRFSYGED